MGPSKSADAKAPIKIAICWLRGVEPTRNPVFKSCEVVPPFEEAMQTMPPIESAVTKYVGPVQPMMRKTRQVRRSVATVMPEVGHEEEPISPVRCDETVVKRNPIATMSSAPNKFHCKCSCGAIIIISSSAIVPPMTSFIDKS